jgi:hypothetical protein
VIRQHLPDPGAPPEQAQTQHPVFADRVRCSGMRGTYPLHGRLTDEDLELVNRFETARSRPTLRRDDLRQPAGHGTCEALLNLPFAEEDPAGPTPDRLALLRPGLTEVAEALRSALAEVARVQGGDADYLRGLLGELLQRPLFSWHWTGSRPTEGNSDGAPRPSPWRPVVITHCLPDVSLLEELQAGAEVLESRRRRADQHEVPGYCQLAIEGDQVLLDGQPVPLEMTTDRQFYARLFLQQLLAAGGQWRSSTEMAGYAKDLEKQRLDQLRKALPKRLQKLIESDRRKGYRLSPSVYLRK